MPRRPRILYAKAGDPGIERAIDEAAAVWAEILDAPTRGKPE